VSEFIIGTVSSYILGNSIEQFSVIIALMMLMMGVAGVCQRFLVERRLIESFVAVEIALALLGGFAPLLIYGAFAFMEHHFSLVLYGTAGALGFLIGFELPLVLRINQEYAPRLQSNLSVILSLDYVGGFVGAIVWTRWMLHELSLPEISFAIASINFAVAVLTAAWFARQGRVRSVPLALAVLATAAALAFGFASNRDWSLALEQRLYDDRIVMSETTRYQRIVLTHDAATDEHRLFLNGNLQLSSSDEHIYHEQLVHPALSMAATRERVLILGGGDGLALRQVLAWPDVREVLLVDLDPRMTELATTHPALVELNGGAFQDARVRAELAGGVRGGPLRPVFQETGSRLPDGTEELQRTARVHILNVDADRFLDRADGLWDAVIVDLPDPGSVELAKLYSVEFYRKLRRALAPGARVALQATSPVHAKEAFLCIQRSVEAAGFRTLPYHDHVPSFGEWGWLLAWTGDESAEELAARIEALDSLPVETRYLTPEVLAGALAFGKDGLVAENTDVNTLLRPVLLGLYLEQGWLDD
jgi:spermidine synthase